MKEINLAGGKTAIVSDEDYKKVSKKRWHALKGSTNSTYAEYRSRKEQFYMHGLIMGKAPKGYEIDHINGNGLDNRRENLRFATRSQNMANTRGWKKRVSKFKGLRWHKKDKSWHARIMINYKHIYLGMFKNEEDAARAYDDGAKKYFGEYARLNFANGR